MTDIFEIEKLTSIISSFSVAQCDFLSESCIVALENSSHTSGCHLSVKGDNEKEFQLTWKKDVKKEGFEEKKNL